MEQDTERAAKHVGFVVIKRNTDYSSERVLQKGSFRCYKDGSSRGKGIRRTAKSRCPFQVNFRRQQATGVYHFTSKCNLVHNHPLEEASTTMTAIARRFSPRQFDTIESLNSRDVPVSRIVEELRKTTNAIVQKRDVYNALQRCERARVDGMLEMQGLLLAIDGNEEFRYKVDSD